MTILDDQRPEENLEGSRSDVQAHNETVHTDQHRCPVTDNTPELWEYGQLSPSMK